MSKIFRYLMMMVGFYLGINWVADNPKKMKLLRAEMNSAIDEGYKMASSEIKSIKREIDQ
tara:strand:- start:705 stop:884 length:180 start_codon:yes stop_codon:yes gene_type:complete